MFSLVKDSASHVGPIPPMVKCPESAPLGLGLERGEVLFEKANFGQGTCISWKPFFGSPGLHEPSRGVAVLSPDKDLQVVVRSCAPGVPPLVEGPSPRSVPSPRVGSPPRRHGTQRCNEDSLVANLAENGSSPSTNFPQEDHRMEQCSVIDPGRPTL